MWTKLPALTVYITNSTSSSSDKNCLEVCEVDNQQINSHVFATNGLLPSYVAFPPPLYLDIGKNAAAVREGLYC